MKKIVCPIIIETDQAHMLESLNMKDHTKLSKKWANWSSLVTGVVEVPGGG